MEILCHLHVHVGFLVEPFLTLELTTFDLSSQKRDILTLSLPADILTLSLPADILTLSLPADILTLSLPADILTLSLFLQAPTRLSCNSVNFSPNVPASDMCNVKSRVALSFYMGALFTLSYVLSRNTSNYQYLW